MSNGLTGIPCLPTAIFCDHMHVEPLCQRYGRVPNSQSTYAPCILEQVDLVPGSQKCIIEGLRCKNHQCHDCFSTIVHKKVKSSQMSEGWPATSP